jgi:hypothetical protein
MHFPPPISIPSDLGTLMVVKEMRKQFRTPTTSVVSCMSLKQNLTPAVLRTLQAVQQDHFNSNDPLALNPPSTRDPFVLDRSLDPLLPAYNSTLTTWTGPYTMAKVNSRVVRRSAAIMDYGNRFVYKEYLHCRRLWPAIVSFLVNVYVWLLLLLPLRAQNFLSFVYPGVVEYEVGGGGSLLGALLGTVWRSKSNNFFRLVLVGKDDEGHTVKGSVTGGEPSKFAHNSLFVFIISALLLRYNR